MLDPLQTVRETLTLFASFYRRCRLVDDVLADVDLREKAGRAREAPVGRAAAAAAVGCALVADPELLFLDGADHGPRPGGAARVVGTRSAGSRRGAVVLTTHSMEEAERLCARPARDRGPRAGRGSGHAGRVGGARGRRGGRRGGDGAGGAERRVARGRGRARGAVRGRRAPARRRAGGRRVARGASCGGRGGRAAPTRDDAPGRRVRHAFLAVAGRSVRRRRGRGRGGRRERHAAPSPRRASSASSTWRGRATSCASPASCSGCSGSRCCSRSRWGWRFAQQGPERVPVLVVEGADAACATAAAVGASPLLVVRRVAAAGAADALRRGEGLVVVNAPGAPPTLAHDPVRGPGVRGGGVGDRRARAGRRAARHHRAAGGADRRAGGGATSTSCAGLSA